MSQVDQSRTPYFNDFNEDKQFYNILNRPGFAIQTREFNQIQSMFYQQIERIGNHFFEEGSVVIPGNVSYDLNYSYVTVNMTLPSDFSNMAQYAKTNEVILQSITTGLKARVVGFVDAEDTDPDTFYLMYLNGGNDNNTHLFQTDETIRVLINNQSTELTQASVLNTGIGSKITVESGVFYMQGKFILVPEVTIPLDKYNNAPSKSVGFVYNEKIVTEIDDNSLYDNAQGSPNFTAPGAHRLHIGADLQAFDSPSDAPDDYYEIFRISEGRLQKMARGPGYNVLGDVLAKRTYDESGNYEVKGFSVDLREHLKDGNRGVYPAPDGDESKFVAGIGPGLAYVKGYSAETLSTTNVIVDKARDTATDNNLSLSAQLGYYITASSISNIPDISNHELVEFYNGSSTLLGTGRVKTIESTISAYNIYLFDVKDTNGVVSTSFISDVRSIEGTGSIPFTAVVSEANAELKGTNDSGSVFGLSYQFVKSLVNPDTGEEDSSFNVIKQYNTSTNSSGQVVISADSNSSFLTQNPLYSYASFTDTTNDVVDISSISTVGGTPVGGNITIDFGVSEANRPVRINVLTSIDEARTRTKTMLTSSKIGLVENGKLFLGKADAVKLTSVTDDDGNDVTDQFVLVNNAKKSFYDISYVQTSESFVDPVTVVFEYFNHGVGDYFSVDSYESIDYKDIPVENGVRLSDVIDFRSRIDDTRTDFVNSGSSKVVVPVPNSVVRIDIEYYLPRRDVIYIDENGTLGVKKGAPDLNPAYPKAPSNAMSLFQLDIPPYTISVDNVSANKSSIRRYTMDDIGRLEDRLDGLEYYVSLSLLEKDAADMQIIDPVTGLNRFKNGFLVDNFESHAIGDTSWGDYHVSIGDGQMRPEMRFNAVDFGANETLSSNIRVSDGIATLDYTEEEFLSQMLRSEYLNVNPYAVFRWEGEVTLSPSVDNWVDVVYTEPRIITRTVTNNVNVSNPSQQWTNNATVLSSSTSTSVQEIHPHGKFVNPIATDFGATTTASRTVTSTNTQQLQNVSTSSSSRTTGDSAIGNEWLPFMRSREVEVIGEGHKPETKLNFFFDDNNMNEYIRPISGSLGDDIITDSEGSFRCVFVIPNNDQIQIPVGTKLFVATDSEENRRELSLSYGDAEYTASSRRESRQRTILVTHIRTIERATITSTNSTTTTWWDPLAQSFLVEETGGIFVTKVDLFFLSKDKSIPVHVDIREMENGTPTQNIIPGSRTLLKPSDVNESEDGSVPSTFTFNYPVYLEEGREYCIMIWANSINYNAFVAKMGKTDLATGKVISKQPYMGVLFKSQNSSTWTPDQNADLQFVLHRARFSTAPGYLKLQNKELPKIRYDKQILSSSNGTNIVNVNIDKHNFVTESLLTLENVEAGNGYTVDQINGSHSVVEVTDMNNVKIEVSGASATSTGRFGGSSVYVSDSAIASFFNLNCNDINYSGTDIRYRATGMTGKSINGSETPYQVISEPKVIEKGGMQSLKQPWMITNKADEVANFNGNPSMTIDTTLSTTNSNVSPVIDLYSFNLICPYYLIDGEIDQAEADGSNSYAKYRTNIAGITNPANSLRIFMDTVFDQNSDVIVSCRLGNSEEEIEESAWFEIENSGNIVTTNDEMAEIEYALDEVSEYTYFQIMVQLKSRNCTRVPVCRNLRVLALGT